MDTNKLDELSQLIFECRWAQIGDHKLRLEVLRIAVDIKRNELLAAIQNDTDSVAQVMWNKS